MDELAGRPMSKMTSADKKDVIIYVATAAIIAVTLGWLMSLVIMNWRQNNLKEDEFRLRAMEKGLIQVVDRAGNRPRLIWVKEPTDDK